jgi:hypothetical protein
MFSPRTLPIGAYLASAMVLGSIVNAAAKDFPIILAQMTPSVCWATCSTPCDETHEKCAADAKRNPDQLKGCRTVREACRNRCRDECGVKK